MGFKPSNNTYQVWEAAVKLLILIFFEAKSKNFSYLVYVVKLNSQQNKQPVAVRCLGSLSKS